MSITNITRTNTVDEWRIQTNLSANELNTIETGDYTKTAGTLAFNGSSNVVIDSEGTSLQVTNTALFTTNVIVGLDISLGSQELTTGNLGVGGVTSIYGPGTALYVANNIVSNGSLIVKDSIITSGITLNANAVVVGTTNTGYLGVANTGVFGKAVTVGTTLTVTGNTAVGNLTTANMVYAGTIQTDGRVDIGGPVHAVGDGTFDGDVFVAGDVNVASNLIVTGAVTGNLTITNTTETQNLIVDGRTDIGGILHTTGPVTFDDDASIAGDLSVDGNFTITGDIVYDTDNLILSAATPVTSGYAYLGVNRGNTTSILGTANANAYLRWTETDKVWQVRDVQNPDNVTAFSKILSANLINTNLQTVANTTVPSTWVAKNYADNSTIGPYIKANSAFEVANAASNTFVGTDSSQAVSANGAITYSSGNGVTVKGSGSTLTVNTAQDLRSTASPTFNGLTLTNALPVTQGGTGSQTAGGALTALLPTGTTSGYVLTTGGPGNFYWAAGGGGSGGSAIPGTAINTSKLTYTATSGQTDFVAPVFTAGTGQLKLFVNGVRQHADYTESTTTLSTVACTGSAGQFSCSSTTLALGQAIVITGALSGSATISQYYTGKIYYVIATNGTTTFTLSEASGGSAITTTSGSITGLSFTTGHKVVLSTGAAANDLVMVEVDGFYSRPYYANNIGFSPTGGIPSTSNTIQLGMESIESRKANLSGAVFTGGISAIAPATTDSSTNIPTTAWIKGLMNTAAYTFAAGTTGNAGSVTNGVYTSGDQTIAGTKTFSSKITGSISGNCDGNAGTVASLSVHAGRNNEANKVVRTDGSGYLQTGYINSSSGDENNSSNPDRVWGTNGSDSYLRTYRTSSLSVNYASSAGGVAWTNVSGRPSNVSSFTNDSGYITSGGRAYPRRSDGGDLNFYWSGQSGQPTWLWGGSDGANMYVYNPSNFSVNYAASAGGVAWSNVSSKPSLGDLSNDRSVVVRESLAYGMGGYGPTYYYNSPTSIDYYEYGTIPSTGWWKFDVMCGLEYYIDAYLYLEHYYATTLMQIYTNGAWRTIAGASWPGSICWNKMNSAGVSRLTWYEIYDEYETIIDTSLYLKKPFYIAAGDNYRMRHSWTSNAISTSVPAVNKTRTDMDYDIHHVPNSPTTQAAGIRGYGKGTERSYGYFGGIIRGTGIRVD